MRKVHINMGVYNVFRECNEGEEGRLCNTDPRVHDTLKPLFTELSKKKPAWKYVCEGWGDMDPCGSYYLYKRFTIIEGDEELGEVWASKNWRTGEYRYAFDCHRLRASRNRGNCTETKDLKRAVKLITSNMYARTLPELMGAERRDADNKARNAIYAIQRDYRHMRDRLMPDIMAFVTSNYDEFMRTGSGKPHDKEDLLERYRRSQMADAAEADVGKNKVLVVERNGQFHVEYDDGEAGTFHSHTLDKLPPRLKEAIALLKLYEKDKLLDGVGIRTNDKTFYIFNGDN